MLLPKFKVKISSNTILILSVILLITLIFTLYWYHFHTYGVSGSNEQWGQFGDYFGGILNPLLSFINILLLIQLTAKTQKLEQDRTKESYNKSVKPFCLFKFKIDHNKIYIAIENIGIGPALIYDIQFKKNGMHIDVREQLKNAQGTMQREFNPYIYTYDNNQMAIGAKDEGILAIVEAKQAGEFIQETSMRMICNIFDDIDLTFTYENIHNEDSMYYSTRTSLKP